MNGRTVNDYQGDPIYMPDPKRVPSPPNAETTDAKVRKLYGPRGEVLLTVSNRPAVGFHQGQRGDR